MDSNTFFGSTSFHDYIPIPMGDNDMIGYTKASYDNGNNTFNGGKSGVESSAAASQTTLESPMQNTSSITIPQEQTFATPALTPGLSTPLAPNYNNEYIQEFLPPLESPAATPNYTEIFQFLDSSNENYFTPLTSPALAPNQENYNVDAFLDQQQNTSSANSTAAINPFSMNSEQQQQQHQPQQQQQHLTRNHVLPANTSHSSPLALLANQRTTPSSPLAFEAFSKSQAPIPANVLPANTSNRPPTAPATPASLMNLNSNTNNNTAHQNLQYPMPSATSAAAAAAAATAASQNAAQVHAANSTSGVASSIHASQKRKLAISSMNKPSPRALRPSISPFLQPNFQNPPAAVSSGVFTPATTSSLSTMDNRRSAHKVAEQRRRDIMKQSFDSLREEIIDVLMADTKKSRVEVERDVNFMSKIVLLKHSYEYIVRLKKETKSKDEKMAEMQAEIDQLKAQVQGKTVTATYSPTPLPDTNDPTTTTTTTTSGNESASEDNQESTDNKNDESSS